MSVSFVCDDGFLLNGLRQLKCVNGNWTGSSPTCIGLTNLCFMLNISYRSYVLSLSSWSLSSWSKSCSLLSWSSSSPSSLTTTSSSSSSSSSISATASATKPTSSSSSWTAPALLNAFQSWSNYLSILVFNTILMRLYAEKKLVIITTVGLILVLV